MKPSLREVKIGDTVYEHLTIARAGISWMPVLVVDQTKYCWRLGNGHKINKKTLITPADRQGYKARYFTAAGVAARNFCDDHARNIGCAVSVCDDPDTLRAIAALIGKELK